MITIRSWVFGVALCWFVALSAHAGAAARQSVTFSVDAITVLAVKQGGSGPGGMDLGAASCIAISDAGVTVNGNRLAWTANVRAKVTIESSTASDQLLVRATHITGKGLAKGWVPVRAGSVVIDGIDREVGGCFLEYMLTQLPEQPATVVAIYTITAE